VKNDLLECIFDLAISIQQIPAPTFAEGQRTAFLRDRFEAEGLAQVACDDMGNVYGCFPGDGTAPALIVTAHLDTVFPVSTDLRSRREDERIYGPGIGDNSLGVAGLLGLVWALRSKKGKHKSLPGDLWLVANVGEEGLGNLRGMQAVVDRFGKQVRAYLVLEGMALGQVYHRALGVQRYRITVCTPGGHAWVDYGRPSAIHELGTLITRLAGLPVPEKPRSSLNVGVISGGWSINTIAAEAFLELDLRSEEQAALQGLVQQVEALAQAAQRPDVQVSLEVIGRRPSGSIPASHPLVQLAQRSLLAQGVQPKLAIGSTDANVPLSRGLPAICIGLSTGSGAHTEGEYVNTRPLAQGLAQLVMIVEELFGL
jgi:acetylornithine deacetylase/succinyl-diaminopimelate desuccinylase-like protein